MAVSCAISNGLKTDLASGQYPASLNVRTVEASSL